MMADALGVLINFRGVRKAQFRDVAGFLEQR